MYKLTNSASILRLTDNATIPSDSGNKDYREYLQWLEEGNHPEYPDPPMVSIPSVVSKFQAKAALLDVGLLSTVETIMADPSTPAIYKLAWSESTEFKRDSPTVVALASLLGLSEEALDALFIKAASIKA